MKEIINSEKNLSTDKDSNSDSIDLNEDSGMDFSIPISFYSKNEYLNHLESLIEDEIETILIENENLPLLPFDLEFGYTEENNCFIRPEDIVRHKCDNPHCINPDHLEIGSNYDNIQDRNKRGRTAKNENHGRAKLTNEQVIEIYHMSGSQQSIADKYGVSQRLVSLIKRKEIHTDILKNE